MADQTDDVLLPIFTGVNQPVQNAVIPSRPAVAPKPVTKKPPPKFSAHMEVPSIKNALAGKGKDDKISAIAQHEAYTQVTEINDFTPEALKQKWEEFLKRLDDRPNLQTTLSKPPQLEEDYKLILEIDNSVQDDLISLIKPELVAWLRKELKNSKIQLITRINQAEKEKIIYSDSEKYLEMLKVNPNLELLKQKFKLDFE